MDEFRSGSERSEKSYRIFRSIRDITMASLIIGSGVLMLGAKWFHYDQIINLDTEFRLFFGWLCVAYGGFRLYRGLKPNY
jgi:uncharacterized membrane protein